LKIALTLLLLAAAPARAEEVVVIKLGTLAPSGSTWHNILKELGERWASVSAGRVKLRIYPGGTQGNEGDIVRKMAVGQLQAAAITDVGMHDVAKEPQALSIPGMIRSEAEFEGVFAQVEPQLRSALAQKGYIPLQWSELGFVRIFCNHPYRTPAAMREAKMFAWDGDPASVEAWRAAGFRPVVLSSTDAVPALQTGMIDCIANVPSYMLTSRLFERANHMIDTPWGYLMGATLLRKEAWEKIPAELRPRLLAIARELGAKVDAEVRRLNDEAVVAMRKQGLDVVVVDPAPWRAAAESAWPVLRGNVVSQKFFDEVLRLRNDPRARAGRRPPIAP